MQVASEVQLTLFDGITTEQLDEAVIQATLQNVKDDPDYDTIAARLQLKNDYKNILGDYDTAEELKKLHQKHFLAYLKCVKIGLLDARMADPEVFDHKKLAAALEPERDSLMRYLGLYRRNRYSLRKNNKKEPLEVPQYTAMRIAMGLSLLEKDPTKTAIEFYGVYQQA